MGKVIDYETFKRECEKVEAANTEYTGQLNDCLGVATQMAEHLMGEVINLATAGPWREWNQFVPDGTSVEFTPRALLETGDENVSVLMEAVRGLPAAVEHMAPQVGVDDDELF